MWPWALGGLVHATPTARHWDTMLAQLAAGDTDTMWLAISSTARARNDARRAEYEGVPANGRIDGVRAVLTGHTIVADPAVPHGGDAPDMRQARRRWRGGARHELRRLRQRLLPRRGGERPRALPHLHEELFEELEGRRIRLQGEGAPGAGFQPLGTREDHGRTGQSGRESPRRSCHSASDSFG